MKNAYEKLLEKVSELNGIKAGLSLLSWDQETMMPPKAGQSRAEALASLSKLFHEKICNEEFGVLLEECKQTADLSEAQAVNVREWSRDREKQVKIPSKLAEDLARSTSLGQRAWSEARAKNKPEIFLGTLEKIIDLKRRQAEYLGYEETAYDALLDEYEPDAKTSELKPIFDELKKGLVVLLQRIRNAGNPPTTEFLSKSYSIATQREFNQKILREIGFDLEAGRLDESAHPFTQGLWPTDVRLTTRYSETDMPSALFGTLHEGGHGIYEQGGEEKNHGTPMAEAVSLGIHESQSRIWENQVGRSLSFWNHYFPQLQSRFPDQLNDVSLEMFHKAINVVKPSLIRVEADEVTYNLHIILRFEMEIALFKGEIEVNDLEEAWRDSMERLLGMSPVKPSQGFLQDVHWSAGLFGYFPTYTLGNIFSAQLFRKAEQELPELQEDFKQGQFSRFKNWLGKNIHCYGRQYSSIELVEKATGEKPDNKYLLEYLNEKYAGIYNL